MVSSCSEEDSKQEQEVIIYVTIASATFSLFGASFMLVSFLLYSKGRFLSQMISFLAFGDLGWAFAVIGQTIALLLQVNAGNVAVLEPIISSSSSSAGSTIGDGGSSSSLIASLPVQFTSSQCAFRFLIYFFGTATYCWTSCISFSVLMTVSKVDNSSVNGEGSLGVTNDLSEPSKGIQVCYHAVGWGLPIGITLMLAPSFNPDALYCSPPLFYGIILYSLVVVAFLFNIIVFLIVLKAHRQQFGTRGLWMYYRSSDDKLVIPIPLRLGLYLLVFFCCWGFDLLTFALLTTESCSDLFALHVLGFAVANLQGAFDCVVYGLISTPLRRNYTWTSGIVTFLLGPLLVFPAMIVRVSRHFSSSRRPSRRSISLPPSTTPSSRDSLVASSSDRDRSKNASWIAIN